MPRRQEAPEPAVLDLDNTAESLSREVADHGVATRLRILWEQRRSLGRVTILGLVLATGIAFAIPKRYQSTAKLMPPDNQSGSGVAMLAALSGRAGSGLGAMAGNLFGLQSTGGLFVGILGSRTVRSRLVDEFNLKQVYKVSGAAAARRRLVENTSISEDRKSGIISLSVTDRSPQRAAMLANAYIDALNGLVAKLTTSSAHRERVFLEQRLQVVSQDLENAEKKFGQFASKNTAINIPEQGKAMVDAAATLQGELIAAQSELEGLRQIYTSNNVRVRSLQARVAELRQQLDRLGGKPGSGGGSLYPSIRELPLLGVSYADLYRNTKVEETIFETLTQEYELAKVEEAKEIPSVKVLDPGNVPEKKYSPPRLLIMFLGTLLSFGFGVTWILGRARWQEVDPQDPVRILAHEVLVEIRSKIPWGARNGHQPQPH
ncbi:MAG TPA: GNVR domain-containing protein [Candidatus Dormibacteraeota bacterium]|nr:GNVR domain-containing protein [Candidatus Dormibacteraeota bacterium]